MKGIIIKGLLSTMLLALGAGAEIEDSEFLMGFTTHFGQSKGHLATNLEMVREIGGSSIRDELYWGSVEREKGTLVLPGNYRAFVKAAAEQGIRPLIICDYGNGFYDGGNYPSSPEAIDGYIRYCDYLMNETKGLARHFQIWNEWDGGCGMSRFGRGSTEAYIRLLKESYKALKSKHPEVVIVANSICTGDATLEAMLSQGLAKYCDVVALHTYNYGIGFQGENAVEDWYKRMEKVGELLAKYNDGVAKPLYITEMGYPNHYNKAGSTYELTAERLTQLYLLGKTFPFLKGVWWYDLQDDGWDVNYNENNFGLVRGDLTPKPAAMAFKTISKAVKTGRFMEFLEIGEAPARALRFDVGGEQLIAVWSTKSGVDVQFTFESENCKTVRYQLAGMELMMRSWGLRDWIGRKTEVPNQMAFTVSGMPLLIWGDLKDVKLVAVTERRAAPQGIQLPEMMSNNTMPVSLSGLDFGGPLGPEWNMAAVQDKLETLSENGTDFLRIRIEEPKGNNYYGFSQMQDAAEILNRLNPGEKLVMRLCARIRCQGVGGRGFTCTLELKDKDGKRRFREIPYQNGDVDWKLAATELEVPAEAQAIGVSVNFSPDCTGVIDIDYCNVIWEIRR